MLGLAIPGMVDFFIVISHERIKTDKQFIEVVLHGIAHVLDRRHPNRDGEMHGSSFRLIAYSIAQKVLPNTYKLPKPYDSVVFNPKEVSLAYNRSGGSTILDINS